MIAQPTVLATHPFVTKYLPDRTWSVEIAAGITADLRIGDDAVLLAAAELHQAAGDLDTAIWTVQPRCGRIAVVTSSSANHMYSCW